MRKKLLPVSGTLTVRLEPSDRRLLDAIVDFENASSERTTGRTSITSLLIHWIRDGARKRGLQP